MFSGVWRSNHSLFLDSEQKLPVTRVQFFPYGWYYFMSNMSTSQKHIYTIYMKYKREFGWGVGRVKWRKKKTIRYSN